LNVFVRTYVHCGWHHIQFGHTPSCLCYGCMCLQHLEVVMLAVYLFVQNCPINVGWICLCWTCMHTTVCCTHVLYL